jgi:glycosyltransferase involved in cell wall biosynthesis
MRVALVAPFGLRPKGTTIARVLPIGRELAHQGAEVRVLLPPWDDPERANSRWIEDRLEIMHTPVATGPLTPVVVFSALLSQVKRWKPDVVHAFKPIGYSGALAWLLAARNWSRPEAGFRPLVVVDCDDLEGPAGWAGRRRQGIGGRLRGIQERRTLARANAVTVASHWLGSFAASVGSPPGLIHYLPNGCAPHEDGEILAGTRTWSSPDVRLTAPGAAPPTLPASESSDQPPSSTAVSNAAISEIEPALPSRVESSDASVGGGVRRQLIWYTRFTEANPGRVADLIAPLLHDDPSLRLLVIGDEIERGDRSVAMQAFYRLGLDQRVEWRSYGERWTPDAIAGPGAVAIYPLDDDLVNRARCPSKIPQLMAMGMPVVAERVGEAARYLGDVSKSCLAAPGDSESFRSLVRALLRDEAARLALAARIKQSATRWSWESTTHGLLDWYRTMSSTRSSSHE